MLDRKDQMIFEIGQAIIQIGLILARHLLEDSDKEVHQDG